jgi:hypothetical protein
MKAGGLVINTPSAKELSEWRFVAGMAYPMIRGNLVPEDLFDEVRRILADRRGEKAAK